jgi:hypothetical protein
LRAGFDLLEAHERYAALVLRVADPRVARPAPGLERGQGVREPALLHEHLRVEHLPLGLELSGELVADARERRFGLREIAALLPDLREEIPRAIVQSRVCVLLEHALEDLAGQPMLAVRQIQAAEHELGFGAVMLELTALLRCEQARQRREVVLLKELEQHLAVGEILNDDAVDGASCDRVDGRQRERDCRYDGETSRHRLLPLLDDELRLLLGLAIRDRELDVLRADALLEHERCRAPVIASVRPLAGEDRDELVLAGLQVADEESLHAAFQQRFDRAPCRGRFATSLLSILSVDGQARTRRDVHRDEHRHLRVGGDEQLLFEHEEILVEIDDVLLEVLYFLVEACGTPCAARHRHRPGRD